MFHIGKLSPLLVDSSCSELPLSGSEIHCASDGILSKTCLDGRQSAVDLSISNSGSAYLPRVPARLTRRESRS